MEKKWLFNCIRLAPRFPHSILYDDVLYVEGIEEEATRFISKHELKRIKENRRFRMDNDPRYTFVCCSVRHSDAQKFDEAMLELQNSMFLLGYKDYEEFCKKAFVELGVLKEGDDDRNKKAFMERTNE